MYLKKRLVLARVKISQPPYPPVIQFGALSTDRALQRYFPAVFNPDGYVPCLVILNDRCYYPRGYNPYYVLIKLVY
jgi:hypothetical protein